MDYTIDWSSIPSDIHDENLRQWLGRTIENVLQKEVFVVAALAALLSRLTTEVVTTKKLE